MRSVAGSALEAAIQDLENRTLANLSGELTKLVYLSSTRDYNTGEYQHAGLAQRHGDRAAREALAQCHQTAFRELLYTSLPSLVSQLAAYIDSIGADRDQVLKSWRQLQAYRVLIPSSCDSLSADFFITNIRIALEALGCSVEQSPGH
ncbi:MAG: hypothetical protein C5B51_16880 [Terriglobia bacterium]|nr:MAG: hypothetical protein C5B51_16880 [Terriglobia bacterium]